MLGGGGDGAVVTVRFEVTSSFTLPEVTFPLAGSIYVRVPIQVGDKGFVVAADAYLGGMSGLGGGVADLSQRANLAALVFHPIGNSAWPACDPNAVVIAEGANGVVLADKAGVTTFVLTPTGIVITIGTMTATFSAAGLSIVDGGVSVSGGKGGYTVSAGDIVVTGGDVIAQGTHLHSHVHPDPQGGSTGLPVG